MGESRVEKFKDYRKSMIHDGELTEKEEINTSIVENSVDSKNKASFQEETALNKLKSSKRTVNILYFGFLAIVVIAIVTFGLILF